MDATSKEFLQRLSQAGDQADLRQVGQDMGLEREQAESLAMGLMVEGLLEVVSLSGAVRLTGQGRELVGEAAPTAPASTTGDGLRALADDLAKAGDLGLGRSAAEDLAVDLATLQAHLGRSKPLQAVLSACLEALAAGLEQSGESRAAGLAIRARALMV